MYRLFFNATDLPLNAKAGVAVQQLTFLDVDVTAAELDAALDLGLVVSASQYAQQVVPGAANGRMLVRAQDRGMKGKNIRVAVVIAGGTVARTVVLGGTALAPDITINPATTGGVVNGSETATAMVAAINATVNVFNLITASVLAPDTGAGLVSTAQALTALGPAATPLMADGLKHRTGEFFSHPAF